MTDRAGSFAYKLQLPTSKVSMLLVFHVGMLRTFHSNGTVQPPPPPELIDDEFEYTVETILDHKEVKRGKQRKLVYLVKWLGYGN